LESKLTPPQGGSCTVQITTWWKRCDAHAFTLRIDNVAGAPVRATLALHVEDPYE
jgi:hypothetical protein